MASRVKPQTINLIPPPAHLLKIIIRQNAVLNQIQKNLFSAPLILQAQPRPSRGLLKFAQRTWPARYRLAESSDWRNDSMDGRRGLPEEACPLLQKYTSPPADMR